MRDQDYQNCLQKASQRLQLQVAYISPCTHVLYHDLSQHAFRNTAKLVVSDTEYGTIEVAALEAVFCALKTKGYLHIPVTIRTK